jgi:hypothetical protein
MKIADKVDSSLTSPETPSGESRGAPKWLRDRMEALRKLPRPSKERFLKQWKALGKAREL